MKDAVEPAIIRLLVAVTVPVAPTAGVVVAHPAGAVRETKLVVAGSTSVTIMAVASLEPLFVAVSMYVMLLPASTGSGVSLFVRAMSAEVVMVVVAEPLLLVVFESVAFDAITAVLVMVEPFGVPLPTLTTTVKLAGAPVGKSGFVAVMVPVPPTAGVVVDQPAGAVIDTNVVFGGRESVTETFEALLGPPFEAVIV